MNPIHINNFDYNLPDEKIAKYPLAKRNLSKLLFYNKGEILEKTFNNLSSLLPENTLLVFNNTKVVNARINFKRKTGANIEVFCLEPISPGNYEQNFASSGSCIWKCVVGNLKKWKEKVLEKPFIYNGLSDILSVEKVSMEAESLNLKFSWQSSLSFAQVIESCGSIPIPPYLKRESQELDTNRYQTVYSKLEGSVAAPTAGLHFTDEIFADLKSKNINTEELTLHVGAGTFKPVKTELANEHIMHSEHFAVSKSALINIKNNLGNITAVGTTSVRTLESLYWIGCKINQQPYTGKLDIEQFEPYNNSIQTITAKQSLENIINYLDKNDSESFISSTQIMITPNYKPKIVNNLITNFHQPKSTLLLLVSAFIGDKWNDVYDYALKNNFRFLSYGDSSLLIP